MAGIPKTKLEGYRLTSLKERIDDYPFLTDPMPTCISQETHLVPLQMVSPLIKCILMCDKEKPFMQNISLLIILNIKIPHSSIVDTLILLLKVAIF